MSDEENEVHRTYKKLEPYEAPLLTAFIAEWRGAACVYVTLHDDEDVKI